MNDKLDPILEPEEDEVKPSRPPVVVDPADADFEILPARHEPAEGFERLFEVVQEHHAHIIGGYVRYLVSPNENPARAGDVDVFMDDTGIGWSEMLNNWKHLLIELGTMFDVEKEGPLSHYFFTPPKEEGKPWGLSVNVVNPRADENMISAGSLHQILHYFDFPVVRAGLLDLEHATVDKDFYEDETNWQLHWKHINCPIAVIYRANKYMRKGYHLRPRELVKVFQDWDERSPEYKERLIDGLNKANPTEEEIMTLEALLWVD